MRGDTNFKGSDSSDPTVYSKGVHRIGLEVPNPIVGKFSNPNPIRNDPVRIRSDPNFKNDSDPIRSEEIRRRSRKALNTCNHSNELYYMFLLPSL